MQDGLLNLLVAQGDIIADFDNSLDSWSSPVLILEPAKWAALAWPLVYKPLTGLYHLDWTGECKWVFVYNSSKWVALPVVEKCFEEGSVGFKLNDEKPVPLVQHCLEANVNRFTFQDLLTLMDHFGLGSSGSSRRSRLDVLQLLCSAFGDEEFVNKVISVDKLCQKKKAGADDGVEPSVDDELLLLLMENFDQDELGALKSEKEAVKKRVTAAKQNKWRSLLSEKLKADKDNWGDVTYQCLNML